MAPVGSKTGIIFDFCYRKNVVSTETILLVAVSIILFIHLA